MYGTVSRRAINLVARSWRGKGSYVVSDSSIRIRIARWIEEDSTEISGILLLSLFLIPIISSSSSLRFYVSIGARFSPDRKEKIYFSKIFSKGNGLIHRPILSRSVIKRCNWRWPVDSVQSCIRRKLDDQIRDIGGCNCIWEAERLDQGCNAVWT